MSRKQRKALIRIICTSALLCAAFFVPKGIISYVLFGAAYLVIGYDILISAVRGIFAGQAFDENFLMATATVGAIALGEYAEAVAVMLFYQIGELFQSIALGKSRRSIGELMDLRPDSANITDEKGELRGVPPEQIKVGDVVTVRPGEKIPLDGVVIAGASSLDTSALTGESVPRSVYAGMTVQSGCVNLNGVITVRVTAPYGESTASKILELVENAAARKSRSEKFITKFARYYTPAVCAAALLLAVLPPVAGIMLRDGGRWSLWIYRALSFLVISCPCALVISIPLTFFAAIGGAGRKGILIKGSDYLEKLAGVKCVVFDKTGTLTEGVFEVAEVKPVKITESELLRYAALAESGSTHPIALSLKKAYGKETASAATEITEQAGRGVIATVDGKRIAVGNGKLMYELGVKNCAKGTGTEVFVAAEGEYLGSIVISDRVKKSAAGLARELKHNGVYRVAMLTGDRKDEAERTGRELSLDEVKYELLPGDKVSALENIMEKARGYTAFVGDGINDAPVIRRADVGIAMGALGSDAAIEAADAVIMDDDPRKTVTAVKLAKKAMSIVYQNIVFAIGIKALCLVLGAFGITNIWAAIFADVGVMVLAVLNALRAMR